jgi:hypothetical protein
MSKYRGIDFFCQEVSMQTELLNYSPFDDAFFLNLRSKIEEMTVPFVGGKSIKPLLALKVLKD